MELNINYNYRSPNYKRRNISDKIDTIIIHYTGMKTAKTALEKLCDPNAEVSSHYFLDKKGKILQLVDDNKIAWHAGRSKWLNRKNLNATSIGIELCNSGHDHNFENFTELQYKSLEKLLYHLKNNYSIGADRVLGHSDIAPKRKLDPCEKFDWQRLAKSNLVVWPNKILKLDAKKNIQNIEYYLHNIGYDIDAGFENGLIAFKRHFIPEDISLIVDKKVLNIVYSVYMAFEKNRALY